MSASRLKWFIALWGAMWTWLLASWSGISPATSLLRATTVFVMLAAGILVFELILDASRGARKSAENRPASEEPPAEKEPQEEREAA